MYYYLRDPSAGFTSNGIEKKSFITKKLFKHYWQRDKIINFDEIASDLLYNTEIIIKIYYVSEYVTALTNFGRIITYGDNIYGFLLCGYKVKKLEKPRIVNIEKGKRFKNIFCSFNNTFAIDENDALWGMGNNTDGSIGRIHQKRYYTMTLIQNDVIKVKNIGYTTFILGKDGNLTCHGRYKDYMNRAYYKEIFAKDVVDFKFGYFSGLHYITRNGDIVDGYKSIVVETGVTNGFLEKNQKIEFRPDRMHMVKFAVHSMKIKTFMLCLKRIKVTNKILPKYLIYAILKLCF